MARYITSPVLSFPDCKMGLILCFGDLMPMVSWRTNHCTARVGIGRRGESVHGSTRAAVVPLVQKPGLVVAHAYNPCAVEGRDSKIPWFSGQLNRWVPVLWETLSQKTRWIVPKGQHPRLASGLRMHLLTWNTSVHMCVHTNTWAHTHEWVLAHFIRGYKQV